MFDYLSGSMFKIRSDDADDARQDAEVEVSFVLSV
jgi:hypothetical protein